MNTSQLRDYAPEARRAFIAAVCAQAGRLGITAKGVADAQVKGDILLVGGQAFPKAYAASRAKLVARVEAQGFDRVMEAIARVPRVARIIHTFRARNRRDRSTP